MGDETIISKSVCVWLCVCVCVWVTDSSDLNQQLGYLARLDKINCQNWLSKYETNSYN